MNGTPAFTFGNAICYSGYRRRQSPREQRFPTREQVSEDLAILHGRWQYLRVYDCSRHADLVLEAIRSDGLDFKVLLGADVVAELNNPNSSRGSGYGQAILAANRRDNEEQIDRLIELSNRYPDIVFAVSIGNETVVEWSDHWVPVDRLLRFARRVGTSIGQPVTYCDNYAPWRDTLKPLAAELDFISIHSYPLWERRDIAQALRYTEQNFDDIKREYPDKPVVITEAGWATASDGAGIDAQAASEPAQTRYCSELVRWARHRSVLTFLFEAFDEPWKGSPDPNDPEKHWGLYTVERKPKAAMDRLAGLLPRTGGPGPQARLL